MSSVASPPSASRLLADFVHSALQAQLHRSDSCSSYDTLLAQLNASLKADDSAAVSRWLHAIAACSSSIAAGSVSFHALLSVLLDHIALHELNADSLPAYTAFLVDFATAAHTQRGAAEAALRKLIDALHYAAEQPNTATARTQHNQQLTAADDKDCDNKHKQRLAHTEQVHAAAHTALKRYGAQHSLARLLAAPCHL